MARIHPTLLSLALALLSFSALAQRSSETPESPLTAEEVMARVAVNQDRAAAERNYYLYVQHARIVSRKGRTIMCEEIADSRVTRSSTGSHSELLKLDGRRLRKSQYVTYTTPRDKRNKPDDLAAEEEENVKFELCAEADGKPDAVLLRRVHIGEA
jgi:hypothetical protein